MGANTLLLPEKSGAREGVELVMLTSPRRTRRSLAVLGRLDGHP